METTLIAKRRMVVARLQGEIDHHAAEEIRNEVERELKRTGAVNVAFDFGNVTFMDSSGIGMLIGRYKTVSALGGSLIIVDASDRILRMLQMAGISRLAVVCDTLRDGIRILQGGK